MTKRQSRMIALAVVLLIALALLGGWYYYYRSTKKLSFNLASSAAGSIQPPQFLFSFSGTGTNHLQRPIGVTFADGKVYVADAARRTIFVYNEDGKQLSSFGTTQTVTPLYIAQNPKDGNLYVTDRRLRKVLKFTTDGKYLGEFNPNLPKSQRPKFNTGGVQWEPIAIAFGPDGTMYTTEVLNGHRLLIFGPDGTFKRSVGSVAVVNDPSKAPKLFQFPNAIMVLNNEVYVSDSNNQRIQVFDPEGNFKRIIVSQGLPRGLASLERFASDDASSPARFVEVDTLAHDVTIWTSTGQKVMSFGEQGVLDGQFSYPDDVARGTRNKLFVSDTSNGRIEVWGWPEQVAGIPQVPAKSLWLCLIPLLLLPLLFLLRKKKFFATADFVERMIAMEAADLMPARRRKWLTTEAEYERIKTMRFGDIDMGELFTASEYSEPDVKALMEKYELDHATAEVLAVAQRTRLFCTESDEFRRVAKIMRMDVANALEFVRQYGKKAGRDGTIETPSDE